MHGKDLERDPNEKVDFSYLVVGSESEDSNIPEAIIYNEVNVAEEKEEGCKP